MNNVKTDIKYKPKFKTPEQPEIDVDIWAWLIFRRIIKYIIKPLAKTNITPNQVTFASLIFGCLAGVFLIRGDYISGLFAMLCIFISHTLDCVDGRLARLKNMQNNFGSFFDSYVNGLVVLIIYTTATIGLFRTTGDYMVIFVGMFALSTVLIIGYLSLLGKYFTPDYKKNIVHLTRKVYFGNFATSTVLFMIGLLFNILYYIFWFIIVVRSVIILKHIVGRYLYYKNKKLHPHKTSKRKRHYA